jgi:hypothetical protein
MAKPTDIPEWASSPQDANDIVVPSAGRKQTGWHRNAGVPEKPPYQFFNWFMNLVYQWISWFDSNINQGVKTTDSPTFANVTITETSLNMAGSLIEAQLPNYPYIGSKENNVILAKTAGSIYLNSGLYFDGQWKRAFTGVLSTSVVTSAGLILVRSLSSGTKDDPGDLNSSITISTATGDISTQGVIESDNKYTASKVIDGCVIIPRFTVVAGTTVSISNGAILCSVKKLSILGTLICDGECLVI